MKQMTLAATTGFERHNSATCKAAFALLNFRHLLEKH